MVYLGVLLFFLGRNFFER